MISFALKRTDWLKEVMTQRYPAQKNINGNGARLFNNKNGMKSNEMQRGCFTWLAWTLRVFKFVSSHFFHAVLIRKASLCFYLFLCYYWTTGVKRFAQGKRYLLNKCDVILIYMTACVCARVGVWASRRCTWWTCMMYRPGLWCLCSRLSVATSINNANDRNNWHRIIGSSSLP